MKSYSEIVRKLGLMMYENHMDGNYSITPDEVHIVAEIYDVDVKNLIDEVTRVCDKHLKDVNSKQV